MVEKITDICKGCYFYRSSGCVVDITGFNTDRVKNLILEYQNHTQMKINIPETCPFYTLFLKVFDDIEQSVKLRQESINGLRKMKEMLKKG